MKQCIKCREPKQSYEFRGRRRTCRICERAYAVALSTSRRMTRQAEGARGYDRENWYRPIGKWPWPPGTKVFEDVDLKRRAA